MLDDDHLFCMVNRSGRHSLTILRVSTGELAEVADHGVADLAASTGAGCAAAVLTYPDRPPAVCLLRRGYPHLDDGAQRGPDDPAA